MPNADHFADKAAKCRQLAGQASNSHVAEQLRFWADEFEIMAAALSLKPVGRTHATRTLADDPTAADLGGTGVDRSRDVLERP